MIPVHCYIQVLQDMVIIKLLKLGIHIAVFKMYEEFACEA